MDLQAHQQLTEAHRRDAEEKLLLAEEAKRKARTHLLIQRRRSRLTSLRTQVKESNARAEELRAAASRPPVAAARFVGCFMALHAPALRYSHQFAPVQHHAASADSRSSCAGSRERSCRTVCAAQGRHRPCRHSPCPAAPAASRAYAAACSGGSS